MITWIPLRRGCASAPLRSCGYESESLPSSHHYPARPLNRRRGTLLFVSSREPPQQCVIWSKIHGLISTLLSVIWRTSFVTEIMYFWNSYNTVLEIHRVRSTKWFAIRWRYFVAVCYQYGNKLILKTCQVQRLWLILYILYNVVMCVHIVFNIGVVWNTKMWLEKSNQNCLNIKVIITTLKVHEYRSKQ